MVIQEAMTAGLPVIATRVGGISDAVGDTAILVDARKPAHLADAMGSLMSDREKRSELALKGREYAEKNYGVERMTDQYVEVVLFNTQA